MEPTLARRVGLIGAAGFGLGAMVGTGVFVTTAVGARLAGPAVIVSLLLAGTAALCNGLSSAELAMNFPRSGGTYEYAGRTLSPWAGFLAGWLFLAAKSTSAAATALGFGAYVGGATGLPPLGISIALVAAVTILGFFRITHAGALNLALVSITVAALLAFVLSALPSFSFERFAPFAPQGGKGILTAAAILFVAYAGYGRVATLGEEITNPRRSIPIAVVLSLAGAIILYISVAAAAIGSIGAEAFGQEADSGAPLPSATSRDWVKVALAIGAATALGSVFLNLMLGLSRMAFAMARGGDFPAGLSRVNPSSSPWAAVLLVGLAIGGLIAVRSIVALLSISAFAVLIYYGLTNLSALRLTREQRLVHPVVPWAGLGFCLALAASVPPRHLLVGVIILAVGILYRGIRRAVAPAAALVLGMVGCAAPAPPVEGPAPSRVEGPPATIVGRVRQGSEPLQHVFVYVKSGLEGRTFPPPSGPVVLDQVHLQFVPKVLGIRVGQILKITSQDPSPHNVHCESFQNPAFNETMMDTDVLQKKFTTPEVMILVKCNIHTFMRAYVGVMDHPFFTVTGQDGKFKIGGLPPGRYVLSAWQEDFGAKQAEVVVHPDRASRVEFEYPR